HRLENSNSFKVNPTHHGYAGKTMHDGWHIVSCPGKGHPVRYSDDTPLVESLRVRGSITDYCYVLDANFDRLLAKIRYARDFQLVESRNNKPIPILRFLNGGISYFLWKSYSVPYL